MLKEIELKIEELLKTLKNETDEWERRDKDLKNQLSELKRQKQTFLAGYDLNKIEIARKIIFTSGVKREFGTGETRTALTNAISDIANGYKKIKEEYFGCKDYAHWSCQYSSHPYGYGPRHGSIVFKIGLKEDKRNVEMDDIETDAVLYYLNMLMDKNFRDTVLKDSE